MNRFCSGCGERLNPPDMHVCTSCRQRNHLVLAPGHAVPAEFWVHPDLQAALTQRHMGRLIRAYRRHPHHGDRGLSQELVAAWAGITQAQLSRIETGAPSVHLDRLIHWARLLAVPPQLLWFHLPREDNDVKRAEFLRLGVAAASVAAIGSVPMSNPDGVTEALAWELWQRRREALHPSELDRELAAQIGSALGATSYIVQDNDGQFALAHPTLVDFFVARRILGGISAGDPSLFTSAQTSHGTDQVLRRFVSRNPAQVTLMSTWMRSAADPVLRVNSAGVLGKLGRVDVTSSVIHVLCSDEETRHRYLIAVASRVLNISWDAAAAVIRNARASHGPDAGLASRDDARIRLATEVANPADGAARWCSLVLLGTLGTNASTPGVGAALQSALRAEPVPENLRALGAVLSGTSPLAV